MRKIVINCVGDSVTEGMSMVGHHTSDYGKASYPARLYTILKDNGYDVEVNNYGHGGECLPEIAARSGGAAAIISEDLIIPDSTRISLGMRTRKDGKNLNTKIKLCYSDSDNDDLCVFFTQMSYDTNPVTIDGTKYIMTVENENENFIEKMFSDKKDTVIPAGSMVFTASKRNPDVNIFYGGINDGASLTLKRFIDIMKKCSEVNGGKYIVMGSTHGIFEKWVDLPGKNKIEKYNNYRRACIENFGVHFIDLYDEFSRHGLDIAIDAGYFKDMTDEQKTVIRENLKNHIMPAEFVYDKISENNVHLSEEGYHVIATIVYERIKLLGYLD